MENFRECEICEAHVRRGVMVRAPWWETPRPVCLGCVRTLCSMLADVIKITDVFTDKSPTG